MLLFKKKINSVWIKSICSKDRNWSENEQHSGYVTSKNGLLRFQLTLPDLSFAFIPHFTSVQIIRVEKRQKEREMERNEFETDNMRK